MIGEIYKNKRINKIEFKKNNSAGHIIIDNSNVESAISKKNIPLKVKCKPNTVTNNVLHTPSSTGIIEGGKSFEISTNQASQNKTNENNISKIAPKKVNKYWYFRNLRRMLVVERVLLVLI